ncbi:MAG: LysM peptidoglycan-binding domain-containing protein [Candidatus Promineifilaceae bacterium]
MEEEPTIPEPQPIPDELRCPQCDSVVPTGSERCIMCGARIAVPEEPESSPGSATNVVSADDVPLDDVSSGKVEASPPQTMPPAATRTAFDKGQRDRSLKSLALWIIMAIIFIPTVFVSFLLLRGGGSQVILALQPTFTPLPPPPSLTPTWTPEASETPVATETPIPSATPAPTDTPQPPRYHPVASGETLFGLSLFYRVSPDSIAESNDIPINSPIQVGQQLIIPWPTATPPLESMILQIGEEQVVVDVTDCEIVTIQEGDSIYGLSGQHGIPAEAIIAVNRLTDESIQMLHPGDTLCVPRVYTGDTLPATPGPMPTETSTAFPAGPVLLYPVNGAEIDPPDGLLRLQWTAVKDLEDDEWYMVEFGDLDMLDSLPHRGFSRDSSFQVPSAWRPEIPQTHEIRWRVSIVNVTGERSDGGFIYDYGGRSSEDSFFFWLGAEPTATPTMTPTPTTVPEE